MINCHCFFILFRMAGAAVALSGSLWSTALSVSSTGRLLTTSGSRVLATGMSHRFRRGLAGSPRGLGPFRRTRSTAIVPPASVVLRSHRRGKHPRPHACLLLDPPEQSHPWLRKHLELGVRLINTKMNKRLLLSALHRCCSDLQPFHSNKDSFVRVKLSASSSCYDCGSDWDASRPSPAA